MIWRISGTHSGDKNTSSKIVWMDMTDDDDAAKELIDYRFLIKNS